MEKIFEILIVNFFGDFFVKFLPRSAMQARIMSSCGVYLSVTFVNSVKTNKRSIKFFSLSGSHTILVFRAKRHSNIRTRTPLTGASNAGGVGKNRDFEPMSGFTACVNAATGQVL